MSIVERYQDQIRENAERLANEHGVQIEFVSSSKVRKESLVKEVLDRRGDHPGLVHILSAMESCPSYRPWHDKNTHKTFLKRAASPWAHQARRANLQVLPHPARQTGHPHRPQATRTRRDSRTRSPLAVRRSCQVRAGSRR